MKEWVQLTRAILHHRDTRRRWLLGTMLLSVGLVAIGCWVADDWLSSSMVLFICYWLGVFGTVCFLMLFALYDLLKTMKGE